MTQFKQIFLTFLLGICQHSAAHPTLAAALGPLSCPLERWKKSFKKSYFYCNGPALYPPPLFFPNFWAEFSPYRNKSVFCLVVRGLPILLGVRPLKKHTFLCVSSLRGSWDFHFILRPKKNKRKKNLSGPTTKKTLF